MNALALWHWCKELSLGVHGKYTPRIQGLRKVHFVQLQLVTTFYPIFLHVTDVPPVLTALIVPGL